MLTGSDDAWRSLVDIAKRRLKLWLAGGGGRTGTTRQARAKLQADLGEYEERRMRAVSRRLFVQASARPGVRLFREEVLGGGPFEPDVAMSFLASPAPRFLSRAQCQDRGIPVVGHRASIVSERRSGDG